VVRAEVIFKTTGATQLVESQPVQGRLESWCEMAASLAIVSWNLSSGKEAKKRWRYNEVDIAGVGCSPNVNDMSTEAEESPLLDAVARERPMKK
jgi:hypothetical protein